VSLGVIVFPDVSAVWRHISSGYIGRSIPYFSFPASGPSGLTPIGMLFGSLFCFIS